MDFAQGYKTIAGATVLVLAYFGAQLSQGEVMEVITATGQAVGAVLTAYGLIAKAIRKIRESKDVY